MGKKKCKTCGNLFEPKGANDCYCSSLCRAAGCYIGGGGDTIKPNAEKQKILPKPRSRIVRITGKDFPRVREMLNLPPTERWRISKDFSDEERAYSRKLARRSLQEDRIAEIISDWNIEETDEDEPDIPMTDVVGESDDGSV